MPKEATACVPALSAVGSVTDGLWSQSTVLSSRNLVFATDASGGPGAKDPRSICVSWAIAAYQIEEGVPQRVASVTCFPESPLSVAQAEQQAVRELFARVEGAFDATIDCKSITSILKKATPPMEGPVDWGNVWQERDRADLHWVPSHKTKDYFAERNIPEWRRLINEDVDMLCGKRAAQAHSTLHSCTLCEVDQLCEDVCLHLARKIGHILLSRKDKSFPWVMQRNLQHDGGDLSPSLAKVKPSANFVKQTGKASVAVPNKKQRLKQLLEHPDPSMGHVWQASATKAVNNFAVSCTVCNLYIEQCNAPDVFNRKVVNPCQDIPADPPEGWVVHASHDMLNKGSFFICSKCLAIGKIAASSASKALREPCRGLARKMNSDLSRKAHAKVAAKQNHSIFAVFGKQSLAKGPRADSDFEGLVAPAPQTVPKAKSVATKPKPKAPQTVPRQTMLSFQ